MRAAALAALIVLALPAPATAQGPSPASSPLHIIGYTDFGYQATDRPTRDGFLGGRAFGELSYDFAERWSFFGEVGTTGGTDHFDLSVERLLVRFDAGNAVSLSLGRFHSPLTYWNDVFPRGAWAWTPIDRPAMLDGAGTPDDAGTGQATLLPTHSLGVRADGRFSAGAFEVGGFVALAGARASAVESGDVALPTDTEGRHAWTLGAHARPVRLSALRIGGAVHGDRLATSAADAVEERILAAHIAWTGAASELPLPEFLAPELLVEYVHLRHRVDEASPADEVSHTANAVYVQVAHRLPGRLNALEPYLRYERIATDAADPVYAAAPPDRRGVAVGVRYDFLDTGALKAEYRNERFLAPDRYASLRLQASFRLEARPRPTAPVATVPAAPDTTPEPVATEAELSPADDATETASKSAPPPAEPEPSRPRLQPVAVVVHPETPVADLSLPELRRIFRGEQRHWPDGSRIVLLIRSPRPDERTAVLGRIYQMDETELRQFWLGRAFRDASLTGLKTVGDVDTARRLVTSLPGTIAFLPAAEVGAELRILRIDGKLPGEDGYPLQ